MMSSILNAAFEQLFARTFVYNILFEDSDVDCRYLDLPPQSRVLSIAGAGCGVAALPSFSVESLDIVDSNLAHLSLTALKTLAPRYLTYDDFFELLGHGRSSRAKQMIEPIMLDKCIPENIRRYWRRNTKMFARGLYRSGLSSAMTRGLARLCKLDKAWITEVAALPEEDRVLRVRNDVCRILQRPGIRQVASSPLQLMSLGINFRQKARIERAENMSFFEHMQRYLEAMSRTDMMRNWFVWSPLVGELNLEDQLAIPPCLRKEFYGASARSQATIRFHHDNLVDVMRARPDNHWTYVNCSDVLDWLDEDSQRSVLELVLRKSAPGGRVLLRSVESVDLIASFGLQEGFKLCPDISSRAVLEDRSCLFRSVNFYDVVK